MQKNSFIYGEKSDIYDSWSYFKYKFRKIEKEEIKWQENLKEFYKMNLCLSTPVNKIELGLNLSALLLFSRKMEVIFGSRYVFITYLITLGITALSFLPCNMEHKVTQEGINPNSLNFAFSQIIFIKYRLEYLNSPLLNIAFLSVLLYFFHNSFIFDYETRNILLSALVSSVVI